MGDTVLKSLLHRAQHHDAPQWRDHARSVGNALAVWFLLNVMSVPADPPDRRARDRRPSGCSVALATPAVRARLERQARLALAVAAAWLASLGMVMGVS